VFKIEDVGYKLSPLYHKQFLFEANPMIKGVKAVEIRKQLW
jgi:hypothetical protein